MAVKALKHEDLVGVDGDLGGQVAELNGRQGIETQTVERAVYCRFEVAELNGRQGIETFLHEVRWERPIRRPTTMSQS